jgi:hypothetical protein
MHTNEHLQLEIAKARHQEDLRKAEQMRLLEQYGAETKPVPAPLSLIFIAFALVASRLNQ